MHQLVARFHKEMQLFRGKLKHHFFPMRLIRDDMRYVNHVLRTEYPSVQKPNMFISGMRDILDLINRRFWTLLYDNVNIAMLCCSTINESNSLFTRLWGQSVLVGPRETETMALLIHDPTMSPFPQLSVYEWACLRHAILNCLTAIYFVCDKKKILFHDKIIHECMPRVYHSKFISRFNLYISEYNWCDAMDMEMLFWRYNQIMNKHTICAILEKIYGRVYRSARRSTRPFARLQPRMETVPYNTPSRVTKSYHTRH